MSDLDAGWLRDQLHYIKQRLEKLEAAAAVCTYEARGGVNGPWCHRHGWDCPNSNVGPK